MNARLSPLLVGYKGAAGPDVLAFAVRWAAASARPLRIVTVYPGTAPLGSVGRVDGEWVAFNRAEAAAVLDSARDIVTASGLDGDQVQYAAIAAQSASRGLHEQLVAAGTGSAIVVGSRNTHGVRKTAPGTTVGRLLQGAPAPVVLVPWDYEEFAVPVRRITVAYVQTIDGEAAVVGGKALADEVGASLELVSVIPDTLVQPSLGEPVRFATGQQVVFEEAVQQAAQATGRGVTARLLEGPVVEALADLRPEDVDLLVCGSRGYGPARSVLLGGVSSRLLKHARVPVVIVPRGAR